jgi:hypothetical protein
MRERKDRGGRDGRRWDLSGHRFDLAGFDPCPLIYSHTIIEIIPAKPPSKNTARVKKKKFGNKTHPSLIR